MLFDLQRPAHSSFSSSSSFLRFPMGILIKGIPLAASKLDLVACIAAFLDTLPPNQSFPTPLHFELFLVYDKRKRAPQAGHAFLTLPDSSFDLQVLLLSPPLLKGSYLIFLPNHRPDDDKTVERLRTTARKDHELERKEEEEEEKEVSKPGRILSIAWGLECRDGVFSVEMERRWVGGQTVFSGTKKTLEISSANAQPDLRIRISFHSIRTITVDKSSSPPSLYLTLNSPSSYELHHPPPPPPPSEVDPSRPLLPTK